VVNSATHVAHHVGDDGVPACGGGLPRWFVIVASLPPGAGLPKRRAKTGLIVGAIVAVGAIIAVAIVGYASTLQPEGGPVGAIAATPQPLPAAPGAPPAPVAPAPAAPQVVVRAPVEPVLLQSNAPGARVLRGGQTLGVTPLAVARPAAGEETYTLSAEGFQDQVVTVSAATASPLAVTLAPRDRRERARPRRDPRVAPQGAHARPGREAPRRTGDLHDPWQ
jgi:hypothetical protein